MTNVYECVCLYFQVHSTCRDQLPKKCPFSQCRVSILPPTSIDNIDSDGYWEARRPQGTSPLLVFVNTKSGDNQVKKIKVVYYLCMLRYNRVITDTR